MPFPLVALIPAIAGALGAAAQVKGPQPGGGGGGGGLPGLPGSMPGIPGMPGGGLAPSALQMLARSKQPTAGAGSPAGQQEELMKLLAKLAGR